MAALRSRRRFKSLQFFDERRSLQVQEPGGLPLVAAGAFERPADERALDARDVASRNRGRRRETNLGAALGAGAVLDVGRQILHVELRPSVTERQRALDDVFELPDVARPLIRHQPRVARPARPSRRPRPELGAQSFCRKCCTSSGMSSRRSRSGGSWTGMTFRR